jgi:hypothetical protein
MRYLILPAALLLLSCGEVVEDTGTACVVPHELECVCDDDIDVGCDPPLYGQCHGEYVDGRSHEVQVWLGYGTGDSWDIECETTIIGDHELSVTAGFRWKPDGDADGEPDIIATCETPPLSEGLWRVHYGEGVSRLTVGSGDTRAAVCVDSGRDR